MIDKVKIEKAIREILIGLGDNPDRVGLIDTPKRVAKMYEEVFEGMNYSNTEIAKMFTKCFEDETEGVSRYHDMVVMKDIPSFSYCEHHMSIIYGMKISVAYIPTGKVIGLSKIARIVDMVCKRLQLQEKIGVDVAEVISMATGSEDVAVIINAEHSCMTARGIKKPGTVTYSSTLRGKFDTDSVLRQELFQILGGK